MPDRQRRPWTRIMEARPPEGQVVETRHESYARADNMRLLRRAGRLWFDPDDPDRALPAPTHWRPARE